MSTNKPFLIDHFGRKIDYARLSVTDRCDFRCVYCMAEEMNFLPRSQILSLEELFEVGKALVASGINKIRLTGGEPLVRNNILWLIENLNSLPDIQELTLTTNGSQLANIAEDLKRNGINRVNVSLDSLSPEKFSEITRTGNLKKVLEGIESCLEAGINVKLNAVILKNRNDDEILSLVNYAQNKKIDLAFIEEMPLGNIIEHNRLLAFCSSDEVKSIIEKEYSLEETNKTTNGPSRYVKIKNSETHIGFISPHSNNFCSSCNRIRITVEGKLLLCLGNEHAVDLKSIIRNSYNASCNENNLQNDLIKAIQSGMQIKPEKHEFSLEQETSIVRFMNSTGG